ncbi:LacI family DNA-binding transcriptional regulator [Aquibacillus albus]|uniref:LacI family transcriptional regulator n=1 Tax=Aquibacillus albus TaxID=1168171 RepID=A0ABS2MZJ5_9BACI|nr:LacI family DNA-binding transcriptional regulator [Aquibacillus albus]MBM7571297.1 LacI family transcriptional regulator [Aquibacillus albus]
MKLTIKEIAKKAGVSPGTVSKVIHQYADVGEATRKKIEEVLHQTGYWSAQRSKSKKRKNRIGIIYGVRVHFNHPFFVNVMNAFSKEVGSLGYDLVFFSSETDKRNYVKKCEEAEVDGCMIIGGDEIQQSIEDLDKSDIPCIGIDIKLSGNKSGYIMTGNKNLGKKVVEHFYLVGHRKMAYIGGIPTTIVGSERTAGFVQALSEFGLPVHDDWIEYGDFTERSGYDAMHAILSKKNQRPTAIFSASDVMALGAMKAIREHNLRIPEDIAIVGCDDIEISSYIPQPLSTMKQDTDKIGKLAAHMISDLINGVLASSSIMVDSELIVRETCGGKR